MGILDDAIRQHLELKRQHGAGSDDLERLESEAFGPATRPGDPEFVDPDAGPDPGTSEAPAAGTETDAAPVEAAPAGDLPSWLGSEEPTTVSPSPSPPEAEPAEGTPAEQARTEHAALGDTADHPAPKQLGPADEAEPPPPDAPPAGSEPLSEPPQPEPPSAETPAPEAETPASEPEPPEAPEGEIFGDGDLDFSALDFEFDDDEPAPSDQPSGGATPEPRVVTPTTTDHDLPPAPVTPASDREDAPAPVEGEPADEGTKSDEDLLEETPDFLREAPEGEDLWFEQGPPRDFDFDDD